MLDAYLESVLNLLTTLPGILGVVAILVCLAVATRSARVAVWLLAAPLFVSCFGRYRYIKAEYVVPLNYFEHYSRPLFAMSLLVLLVAVSSNKLLRARIRICRIPLTFFVFQIYYAVLMIFHGVEIGWMALVVYCISFSTSSRLLSSITATRRYSLFVEAVVLAGAIFTFACCYQYVQAPSNSVWAGRFIGITNNAQHTAQFLSLFLIPTVYYMVSLPRGSRWKYCLGFLLFLEAALLLFTGSRTGMLMSLAGMLILMRRQSRHIVASLVSISAIGFILALALPESESATQRVLALHDSRTGLFRMLWAQFLEHPIFGEMKVSTWGGTSRAVIRENSYLMVASMMGLVGIFIMGLFWVQFLQKAVRLVRLTSNHAKPGFPDLILASMASILVGAVFEGFLFAIVGPCYLLLYAYSGFAEEIASRPFRRNMSRTKPL